MMMNRRQGVKNLEEMVGLNAARRYGGIRGHVSSGNADRG